jgi:hypothetical protein
MGHLNEFQKRFIALRQTMLVDGAFRGLPTNNNVLRYLVKRLENEGSSFIKVTLPKLGKALDNGLVSGHFECPKDFRVSGNTRLPLFGYEMFCLIFEDAGALRNAPSVEAIGFLRQFLLFESKLFYEPTIDQKNQAVDEFATRMRNLRRVRINTANPLLQRAKWYLTRALKHLDLSSITPGHGPGVVAERLDKFERWDFNTWSVKAERFYPYIPFAKHSLHSYFASNAPTYVRQVHTRCALVPKDFKGPRLISAESVVNQYLQQGQMKRMMEYFATNPLLRCSIRLKDQSFNQRAAARASQDCLATVDLSSASDTVSVPLVWFLLSGVPKLRRFLMATRSDYMLYADRKIRITSFAPMGSATCFPVETLVFWSLAIASLEITRLHPKTGKPVMGPYALARDIRVFGDDIIIPEEAYPTLSALLTSVGCEVNVQKTCYRTPFRESCGTEWYGRFDVSLIRNRQYDYGRHDVSQHPIVCSLQRKFFSRGYFAVAALLSKWAQEIVPTPTYAISSYLPKSVYDELGVFLSHREEAHPPVRLTADIVGYLGYFERESLDLDRFGGLLGWEKDLPSSLKTRFNRSYQRTECRLPTYFQRSREWVTGGYPRLMARLLGDKTDRIALRDLRVRMAWTEIP